MPGRIGAAIAKRFTSHGANIYIHELRSLPGVGEVLDGVLTAGARSGATAEVVFGDLTKPSVVEKIFSYITPDVVINNAGVFRAAVVHEHMSRADYLSAHEEAFDLNVAANMKTAFMVTEAAVHYLKHAQKEGVILFAGDAFIERTGSYPRNLAAYTASKAFIPAVVRQFAKQHGREGIRFLGVLNGTIEPPPSAPQSTIEHMQREIPLPSRLLNPWLGADAIAEAIDHLIRMQTVNGTTLTVDGGRTWTTKEEF